MILAVLALTWPITAATAILALLIGAVWAVVVWWGLYTGTRLLRVRSTLTRDRTTSWGLWWGAFVLFAALYRATVERVPFEATVVFVTMLLGLSAMLVASRRNIWTQPLYRQVLADAISRTQLQIARIDQQLEHRPYLSTGRASLHSHEERTDGGVGS